MSPRIQSFCRDFHRNRAFAGSFGNDGELAREQMHLRVLERLEAGGVTIADGLESSCSAHLHADQAVIIRNDVSFLVQYADIQVNELRVGDSGIIRSTLVPGIHGDFQGVCLPGCPDSFLLHGPAFIVVSHDSDFSRLILHVRPDEAVSSHQCPVVRKNALPFADRRGILPDDALADPVERYQEVARLKHRIISLTIIYTFMIKMVLGN